MHARLPAPTEPVNSQLRRHCDIVRRAADCIAKEADSYPPESGIIADQITFLQQQSAAAKETICENVPRSSFIDPAPEESIHLTSAFHELVEAIVECAQFLAVDVLGPVRECAAIACNLVLQSVTRMYESMKRGHPHTVSSPRHLPADWITVRALDSEISRILQRDLPRACDEEAGSVGRLKLTRIEECLGSMADRCRNVAGLMERIYAYAGRPDPAASLAGGGLNCEKKV